MRIAKRRRRRRDRSVTRCICSVHRTRPSETCSEMHPSANLEPVKSACINQGVNGSMNLSVLVPERLDAEGVDILRRAGLQVDCKYDLTEDAFRKILPNYDGLIVRSGTKLTRELLDSVNPSKLRVIGRAGVGVDNIDLSAASERGIVVVNAPTGNCVAAAELTVGMIMVLARNIAAADASIKSGKWCRNEYMGVSLVDKTLGICGFGRIGREVARRCRGLGMKLYAYDPFCAAEVAKASGVDLLSTLDELLAVSDYITVHMPLTETTQHMLNRTSFLKCKKGVRVLNIARGGIIDEAALLEALESGQVAGAALDVFEKEPPSKYPDSISSKLVQHPLVVATPHLGASTIEAQLDVALEVSEAVVMALRGDFAPTTVNAPSLPPEMLANLKQMSELAVGLGKLAIAMTESINHVTITYAFRDAEKRNATRFLRASVLRGILQASSAVAINYVNADVTAERRGLTWTEVIPSFLGSGDSEYLRLEFDGHLVQGCIMSCSSHVTRIDNFDIDICLNGRILAYEQVDRPGMIGTVGSILGNAQVNISFMTLGRDQQRGRALVMLGVDSEPDATTLEAIASQVGNRPRVLVFS